MYVMPSLIDDGCALKVVDRTYTQRSLGGGSALAALILGPASLVVAQVARLFVTCVATAAVDELVVGWVVFDHSVDRAV